MDFQADTKTLKLSVAEINALRLRLKLTPNDLSMIPRLVSEDGDAIVDMQAFSNLATDQQSIFLDLIRTLCNPESSILWNETVSDLTFSRNAAAWVSAIPDRWAVITIAGDDIWLRSRSTSEICQSFIQFLAVHPGLARHNFHLAGSTSAAITSLAALDQSMLLNLHSKLTHTKPASTFSAKELLKRIEESDKEDFRWPLLFLEELIPVNLKTLLQPSQLNTSLAELTQAGLLVSIPDDDKKPNNDLFMFTQAGEILEQGFLHETAKVGIRVSSLSENGEIIHEVLLLLRDPFSLWLMDLTGSEGAILDLGEMECKQIIGKIFKNI